MSEATASTAGARIVTQAASPLARCVGTFLANESLDAQRRVKRRRQLRRRRRSGGAIDRRRDLQPRRVNCAVGGRRGPFDLGDDVDVVESNTTQRGADVRRARRQLHAGRIAIAQVKRRRQNAARQHTLVDRPFVVERVDDTLQQFGNDALHAKIVARVVGRTGANGLLIV